MAVETIIHSVLLKYSHPSGVDQDEKLLVVTVGKEMLQVPMFSVAAVCQSGLDGQSSSREG